MQLSALLSSSPNGEHGDTGDIDLGALAAVANFMRDGPFAIVWGSAE
jgi:hypothetical protein